MWLRALVVGAVGMATGVASHLLGGGLLPGSAVMTVLLVATVLLTSRFLLSWAGPLRLVGLVLVAQGAWHLALSLTAGHSGDPVVPAARPAGPVAAPSAHSADRTGPLRDLYEPAVATAPGTGGGGQGLRDALAHQVHHLTEQGPLMVLSHLGGAALLGLFLAYGERVLWSALALAAAVVVARVVRALGALPLPRPARRPLVGRPAPASWTPTALLLAEHLPRRGPPAVAAA